MTRTFSRLLWLIRRNYDLRGLESPYVLKFGNDRIKEPLLFPLLLRIHGLRDDIRNACRHFINLARKGHTQEPLGCGKTASRHRLQIKNRRNSLWMESWATAYQTCISTKSPCTVPFQTSFDLSTRHSSQQHAYRWIIYTDSAWLQLSACDQCEDTSDSRILPLLYGWV